MSTETLPPRLLVVDDIEDNRTILRRRFTRLGYDVLEAENGDKALSMVGAFPFDVVLLDVMMPGVDGLEVLRKIRETHGETQLPVIMVTAKAASEDVVEALLLGANDYITKPVDMEIAAVRVDMQLRRKRAEDQSRLAFAELEQILSGLSEAVVQAQNRSALLGQADSATRAPLTGVLGAARVLTRLCDTPALKRTIAVIEDARTALDQLILEAARPGAEDRRRDDAERRILVLSADESPARRTATRAVFGETEAPIEIVEAHGGLEAAQAATGIAFDLILISVDMADGLDGIRAIRKREAEVEGRRRPIIALAGDAAGASQALAAGADLHMVTPINAARLLAALATALRRESEDLTAAA
jgi:DNA-binding response OmpR family regulator